MRRFALLLIMTALLIGTVPHSALAWCNGPARNGRTGDGYGTHDWILDRSIRLAGSRGTWVNRNAALLTTDDPDTRRTNAFFHWYKESGSSRGAPFMVGELYHKAVVAYRAGDMLTASRHLGTLSHYYADITQPFHTTNRAAAYNTIHNQYEYAVDDYQHTPTGANSWVIARSRIPVTDVRAKTVSAALYARSLYPALFTSFRASRRVNTGTPYRVTRLVMSRSANDLADIISSIPDAAGEAPIPATVNMSLSHTYPRQYQRLGAYVTCTDAAGQPLNAVGVKFVWNLPSGTKTWLTFTDSYGRASRWEGIGAAPLMRNSTVTAYVIASGKVTAVSRTFMATRIAAAGTAGVSAGMVDRYPAVNTAANIHARILDTTGHAIVGIPVTFTWTLDGRAQSIVARTDAAGIARISRNIGNAPVDQMAIAYAVTQVGGYNRSAAVTFYPKEQ